MKNFCKACVSFLVVLSLCGCATKYENTQPEPLVSQNPTFKIIDNAPMPQANQTLNVEKNENNRTKFNVAETILDIMRFTIDTLIIIKIFDDIFHF